MIRAFSRVLLLIGVCSSALAVLASAGFSGDVGAAPGAEPQVLVALAGDRPDAWKLQAAVANLLGLEGIAIVWRRSSSPPTVEDLAAGEEVSKQAKPDHRVLVDLTDPAIVSLRLLATAGAVAPAGRIVEASVLDEATCETVAQILRSIVLAPGASPPVSASASAAIVSASPPQPLEPAEVARRRRFELRSGYVAAASPGDLGWLSGVTLAGSWAIARGAESPVVVLGLSRLTGDFAAPNAPANADLAIWSARAGLGWEHSWGKRWWVAAETSVGPDWLAVTPRTNGATGDFMLAGAQRAVRLAFRPLIRGEVALAGPLLLFLQLHADLMPEARANVIEGTVSRTYTVQGRADLAGAIGVAFRP
jgi:hypothetical protein